jgi:hypothetical protein
MPITERQLEQCIRVAGFPFNKRKFAFEVISAGLMVFREHRQRRYYGSKGRSIKKPTSAHAAHKGRHRQDHARFVLIAALYRAWWRAFGTAPTLNHKSHLSSPFETFAIQVLSREGIGHIHQHLEAYGSYSKAEVSLNTSRIEKWRVSGGSEDGP